MKIRGANARYRKSGVVEIQFDTEDAEDVLRILLAEISEKSAEMKVDREYIDDLHWQMFLIEQLRDAIYEARGVDNGGAEES